MSVYFCEILKYFLGKHLQINVEMTSISTSNGECSCTGMHIICLFVSCLKYCFLWLVAGRKLLALPRDLTNDFCASSIRRHYEKLPICTHTYIYACDRWSILQQRYYPVHYITLECTVGGRRPARTTALRPDISLGCACVCRCELVLCFIFPMCHNKYEKIIKRNEVL